jgi:Na+-transporting methylmalonyl-CoA/oxaloacetate decarboxylase gamma subunit
VRAKLLLMLVVAIVIAGGIAHEAFAGRDAKPQTASEALTPAQRAARKKLLATAAYLKQHKQTCGCQHHFPAPKP